VAGVLAIAFVALLWAGFLALISLAMLANWRDKRKRKRLGIPESPRDHPQGKASRSTEFGNHERNSEVGCRVWSDACRGARPGESRRIEAGRYPAAGEQSGRRLWLLLSAATQTAPLQTVAKTDAHDYPRRFAVSVVRG